MNPIVSVIIPVYNRGALVRKTLDSVLAQTVVESLEIIVIDDGSTDNTLSFLQNEYSNNAQIRVINQKNAGVAVARNRGLKEAKGEFVAFLDHDDIWLPQKLARQIAVFQENPEAVVVSCLLQNVDECGEIVDGATMQATAEAPPEGDVYELLLRRNFLVSMSAPLIRRAALQKIGGFDTRTVPCDDWDLWLRLARRDKFYNVPEVLVQYRRHEAQQSQPGEHMIRAAQRVMFKQWRTRPFKARLLWHATSYSALARTWELHTQAREALFENRFGDVTAILKRVALRHPLALFSPHWLYLTLRFLKHDSRPY